MVFISFLVNLLCAFATCPPNFGQPGTSVTRNGRHIDFDGNQINSSGDPIVMTESGAVEGYLMKSVTGQSIYAFEGIPYAIPPVGSRRFRPPIEVQAWTGIKSVKSPPPYCLQMHTFFLNRIIGTEDCLHLSVFSPKIPAPESGEKSNLSVIIYIHGGSFQFGGAREYGPAYLLDNNPVILVTMNYRLGILGFLSTGDEASPGNNGLRDQELAIKWVYDNIEKFGGDKSKITLMGQSAGGVGVHIHMTSKRDTKNYFQKAISMSASSFNFWAIQSQRLSKIWTQKAAKLVHCPVGDSHILMDCLRSINPVQLVSNQFHMQDYFPSYPSIMFGPTMESDHEDAVVTQTAREIYAQNNVSKIPYVVTNTDGEGEVAIISLPTIFRFNQFRTNWRTLAPIFLDYKNLKGINQDLVTDAIEKYYFKNGTNARSLPMTVFSDMTSDRYFSPGVYSTLKAHSRIAPTYSLVFGYKGRFGIPAAFGFSHANYRVSHAEDLFYIFNMTAFTKGLDVSQPEYQISKVMTDWIVRFAETGVPAEPEMWPPVQDINNIQQLSVDNPVTLSPYPKSFLNSINFWENLNLTENNWGRENEIGNNFDSISSDDYYNY